MTYFFTVVDWLIRFKKLKYAQNMNKARFSYFSWFFSKNCSKLTIFFIFGAQFFFTHTSTISDLLFYSCGLVHHVWNAQICTKIWITLVFLIFLDFLPKIAQKRQFFIFGGQFFFTHTLTILNLFFYSFELVHQVWNAQKCTKI